MAHKAGNLCTIPGVAERASYPILVDHWFASDRHGASWAGDLPGQ